MCINFKALTLHSTGISRKKKPAFLANNAKNPYVFLHLYNEGEHHGEAKQLSSGFNLIKLRVEPDEMNPAIVQTGSGSSAAFQICALTRSRIRASKELNPALSKPLEPAG
jgi:hypothetical protein